MDTQHVLTYLQRNGITVHLVTPHGPDDLIIFLEATLGQATFAECLLRQLPQVQQARRNGQPLVRIDLRLITGPGTETETGPGSEAEDT